MTDLIQQAEALEANATVAEHAAKSQHADAERWRAEAAKLREQAAMEPLRLWVNVYCDGSSNTYKSADDAYGSDRYAGEGNNATRIAVPMVEVRPVRITDEQVAEASAKYRIASGWYSYSSDGIRAVMAYALSLAGVEVEK